MKSINHRWNSCKQRIEMEKKNRSWMKSKGKMSIKNEDDDRNNPKPQKWNNLLIFYKVFKANIQTRNLFKYNCEITHGDIDTWW